MTYSALFEYLHQIRCNPAKQSIKADKLALGNSSVARVGSGGKFPDLALMVNDGDFDFCGGELTARISDQLRHRRFRNEALVGIVPIKR